MDPRTNPFSPGAGNIPRVLAGRDELIRDIDIELERCKNGYHYRGYIMVGLRGVGKTALLNKFSNDMEGKDFWVASAETPEDRSLPSILIPPLQNMLVSTTLTSKAADYGKRS